MSGKGGTTGPVADDGWIDLCAAEEVPPAGQGGRYVVVGRRALAVFRQDEAVWVVDDACPHAGASLSAGRVEDGCAVCPWHGWAFALADGRCPDNPAVAVRTCPSRIADGRVQARLA